MVNCYWTSTLENVGMKKMLLRIRRHRLINAESSPTLNMIKFVLLFYTNRPLANLSLWIFSEFFHGWKQSSQDAKFSIPPMVMKFTIWGAFGLSMISPKLVNEIRCKNYDLLLKNQVTTWCKKITSSTVRFCTVGVAKFHYIGIFKNSC